MAGSLVHYEAKSFCELQSDLKSTVTCVRVIRDECDLVQIYGRLLMLIVSRKIGGGLGAP